MDDQPRSRGVHPVTDPQQDASDVAQHRRGAVRLEDVGATAVEYALLIAFIATMIVGAGAALGLTTSGWFVVPCLGGPTCP